jgi:hypothetical protein
MHRLSVGAMPDRKWQIWLYIRVAQVSEFDFEWCMMHKSDTISPFIAPSERLVKNYMLNFDYEPVQGQVVKKILGIVPLAMDDGTIHYDEVKLALEGCSLVFSVDENTDEVLRRQCLDKVDVLSIDQGWVDIDVFSDCIGSEIGWIWCCKNYLGYNDMMIFSYSGIAPTIALLGICSKLSIYRLSAAR